MTTKQERAMLREIGQVYQNSAERVAICTRWRWVFTGVAGGLAFLALRLSSVASVDTRLCLLVAFFAGMAVGVTALFSTAARQTPLLVRYTTLREDDIQKRLEELKDA